MTLEDGIAGIKTGDDQPYYLLKLTFSPHETALEVTNDYKCIFPLYHCVIAGNYLEVFKKRSDGNLYCVNITHKAIIFSFSEVRNCPTLPKVTEKKRREMWRCSSFSMICTKFCLNLLTLNNTEHYFLFIFQNLPNYSINISFIMILLSYFFKQANYFNFILTTCTFLFLRNSAEY